MREAWRGIGDIRGCGAHEGELRTWGTRGSMGERISMTTVVLFKPAHSMILWFYDMGDRTWHWGHEGSGQDRRGRGGHEGTWEIGGGLGDRRGHGAQEGILGTVGVAGDTKRPWGQEGICDLEGTQGTGGDTRDGRRHKDMDGQILQDTRGRPNPQRDSRTQGDTMGTGPVGGP